MFFPELSKYRDGGLLFLRVGLGSMFIAHGAPKLFGGPDLWAQLGTAAQSVGMYFFPTFWGFMAATAEFFGGILLILGLFFREACIFLLITMFIASAKHIAQGDGFRVASHAIELGIVFLALIFIGGGAYSIDEKILASKKRNKASELEG